MANWYDKILSEFTPQIARLTLVADPDGLLVEERVLEEINRRGFELIPFEDHVAFRYAYETGFRSRWDRGEQTDLVVVLRSGASDLGALPYDLLNAGRRLSFSLGEIFPNLSYPIVAMLDSADLDALYAAQKQYSPDQSGDNATKEFILRHVFRIAPELIRKPPELLRTLLRRHYRKQHIPQELDQHLIQLLRQQDAFKAWPLDKIVPDREAFFAFLQERWALFLDFTVKKDSSDVAESEESYGLEYPGPVQLPFDHDDIRIYIDNLFVEGMLEAVPHEQSESLSNTWVSIGIKTDKQADRVRRLEKLLASTESDIPKAESRHGDWFQFVMKWSEITALVLEPDSKLSSQMLDKIKTLQTQIDDLLSCWLNKRFAGLINLPPAPPVMLHHIPRFLARRISDNPGRKAALVLLDGLSLDQWIALRKELTQNHPTYRFRENTVFAWIPTLTSVSRQAVFSGKSPIFFPNSINTTSKEPALWTQFWVDQGLKQQEVAYAKGLGDGDLNSVEELVDQPQKRVIGLVIDKIDKIMHGMELGNAGMHQQVRQWAGQPFMGNLIDLLLNKGFSVFLTSDHGNVEATGCGQPKEGAVADLRGERVRIYPSVSLRDQVKEKFPGAICWPTTGLPEDYLPLIASGRSAFVKENKQTVSHGGGSLEEIVVPFIKIESRST